MVSTRNMYFALGSYLILASSFSFADDTTQSKSPLEVHPYFKTAESVILPENNADAVTVNGFTIPESFTLSTLSEQGADMRFHSPPLTFVLVRPQKVKIDDIKFSVDDPFYIATTELSNAQAADLLGANFVAEGYDFYVVSELVEVAWDWYSDRYEDIENFRQWSKMNPPPAGKPESADDVLLHVIKYLVDLDKPTLAMDPQRAALKAKMLTKRSKLFVRIPTLAEWFAAMRAGSNTNYWFGDELDMSKVSDSNTKNKLTIPFPLYLGDLYDVDEGETNPIGLHHVLGNVEEVIYPSMQERNTLRKHFGPHAIQPHTTRLQPAGRYTVHGMTWFRIGGSVRSHNEFYSFRDELKLETLLRRHQTVQNLGLGYTGGLTGVRFVIDLPPSDIKIVNQRKLEKVSEPEMPDNESG